MRIFHKIRNKLNSRKKVLLTLSTLVVLVATPIAVHAGFGPDRPTFDYNNFNGNTNCFDVTNPARNNGRCGSLTGPVFDSFVNVPNVGDERDFLDGYRSDNSTSFPDPVTNVTDGAQEVTMRLYIHNNANDSTDCLPVHLAANGTCTQVDANAPGIAHNTSVRIALPGISGNDLRSVGYISASNATPGTVEDSLDMTSTKDFTVQYEPGSAKLFNNGPFTNGVALSDSIVTSGAPVGYNALNGDFPGCFNYIATVQIKVKIIPKAPPTTPVLHLTKLVRQSGTSTWGSEVAAKPGDDEQWELNTQNTGTANLTNVITRDVLPPHLQLDPGTVQVINAKGTRNLGDGPLFAGGFNLGQYNPNDNTLVTFRTKVLNDFDGCSIRVRNYAFAKSDQTPNEINDTADVVITKPNCNVTPPPTPTYSCDAFSLSAGDNRTVTVNSLVTSAANGATFKNVVIDWGDSSTPLTTTTPIGQTHKYSQDGTFTVTATAHFTVTVNGQTSEVTATSPNCTKPVTFSTTTQTPTFTCDLLQITSGTNRLTTYKVSTTTTGGAQVSFYRYDFGDGTPVFLTDKDSVQHTYAKDGQFASHVQVGFNVNGQTQTVDSPNCSAAVTYNTPPPPPPSTPPTTVTTTSSTTPAGPTQLVNTGPGSVVAIFAATTIGGTFAYRWYLGRRLSRQ